MKHLQVARLSWTLGGAVLGALAVTALPAALQSSRPAMAAPAEIPNDGKLRILVFGAHPDDAEIRAAGSAAKWAAQGHHVKFVSMTNGDIGHWQSAGGPLAQRRLKEVQKCADILGISTEVMDIHDG
ncbi:MAG: PIG-L deacetylase family protein, partial [Actinomycetota bacterium]